MIWTPNRRDIIRAGAAALMVSAAGRMALGQDIPASPESGPIKMGIEPWLGYGQWHIAAKKGYFKQVGLESVEISPPTPP
jgi:NitT/TauT family transport system substrate-binding protein